MESIEDMVAKLKADTGRWEEVILGWAYELAQEVTKFVLEEMDEALLMKNREEGLKVEGFKGRLITTFFGDVKIRRRLYRD